MLLHGGGVLEAATIAPAFLVVGVASGLAGLGLGRLAPDDGDQTRSFDSIADPATAAGAEP